jgi:copper(I)-binding protein
MICPCRQRPAGLLAALLLSAVAHGADAPAVSQAWARATPPGVDVGAAYMVIQGGSRPDALVGADSERAAMVHLHVVEESGGLSKMRSIDSVEVPPGRRIELQPKSTHLMLMGLDGPLVAGESFPLTLHFAESGSQTVSVLVKPATADDGAPDSRSP